MTFTPRKFNSSPLKIGHPKRKIDENSLLTIIFQGLCWTLGVYGMVKWPLWDGCWWHSPTFGDQVRSRLVWITWSFGRLNPWLQKVIFQGRVFLTKNILYPGSPVDQAKWLVFRIIHGSRIPDPTKGRKVWFLDFVGYLHISCSHGSKPNVAFECSWTYFCNFAWIFISTPLKLKVIGKETDPVTC